MTGIIHHPPQARAGQPEVVPGWLVGAMIGLALASLALVSFAVLTGRSHVGVPAQAAPVAERSLILDGHGARAVTVRDAADGRVIADLAHGGFVAVVQNGLAREREVHGLDPRLPVRLVAYANGRLALVDPETGWSVELGNFGNQNRAAFERLMTTD
ncbi:MAG: photosynthetic complex assembly protein PuhC [Rhodobacteraceae bacterium]|nr:photosynthetic complex assembly protein PuhC [Paracoccaceae bacterium]